MQVSFMFRVLSGNIDFPVNVLFFTSNGNAQGNVSCLVNALYFFMCYFYFSLLFKISDRYLCPMHIIAVFCRYT